VTWGGRSLLMFSRTNGSSVLVFAAARWLGGFLGT
jgi:hypothetical protein